MLMPTRQSIHLANEHALRWISARIPLCLVYWCVVRVAAMAWRRTGKEPREVTIFDALDAVRATQEANR